MKEEIQNKIFYLSWLVFSISFLFVAILTEGTGGSGDSLFHYMYAKYAWQDSSLFFNHWAKPFFTIIASPFAQFGFLGIKVFNVLSSSLTVLFAYKISEKFQLKFSYLIVIPFIAAPFFSTITFSGLTEPFSALILTASILLWLQNKKTASVLLISFMPFIRSEGLLILGVFGLLLLWNRDWKKMPFLLAGHVIMSLVGFIYYKDLLWVFNRIPYAHLSSVYGIGRWDHFVTQLYFCLGPITFSLLGLGLLKELYYSISRKGTSPLLIEKKFLVYLIYLIFFFAHTAFWALGIFNSMGLNRVFVTVLPLVAIIAIDAAGWIGSFFSGIFKKIIPILILLFTLFFTFLKNPASSDFKNDIALSGDQVLLKEKVIPYLSVKYPKHIYVSGDLNIAYFSDRNIFNKKECLPIYGFNPETLLDSTMVFIWDPWFAKAEGNLDLETLKSNALLKVDTVFSTVNKKAEKLEYIVFIRNKNK